MLSRKKKSLTVKKTSTDTDIKWKKQTTKHTSIQKTERLNKFRREKAALMSVFLHGPKFPCVRKTDNTS